MFGRVPGFIRFVADPQVWREIFRLRRLVEEHRTHTTTASTDLARFVWKMLCMQKIVRFGDTYVVNSFAPPFPSKAFETMTLRSLRAVEYGASQRLVLPPVATHVAITNNCPLHCWHCSNADRPGQRDMPTEHWLKVLAELQEWGVCMIAFTGGEPLVHPQLEQMIASLDERSVTFIFTSGFGLDARRARRLKDAGLFGVIVSLDHYEEARHDQMRGFKGAHTHAIRALEESRSAGMYTILQLVTTKELLHSGGLYRMFELGRRLNVHEVRVMSPVPTGRLFYAGDDVLLTEKEQQQIIEIDKHANGLLGYPKVCSFNRVESTELLGCGAGSLHSYIDAAGNVYPCDLVPLSFGSVVEQSFRDIWCQVSTLINGPRSRCFMHDNVEAVRQAANGQLPLPAETSRRICQQCQVSDAPDRYHRWGQIWQQKREIVL